MTNVAPSSTTPQACPTPPPPTTGGCPALPPLIASQPCNPEQSQREGYQTLGSSTHFQPSTAQSQREGYISPHSSNPSQLSSEATQSLGESYLASSPSPTPAQSQREGCSTTPSSNSLTPSNPDPRKQPLLEGHPDPLQPPIPPPQPNHHQLKLTCKAREKSSKLGEPHHPSSPKAGRCKKSPAKLKSLPLGFLTAPLLTKSKPAIHYHPLPSLKDPPFLLHDKLHGYLGASPIEGALLREETLTEIRESRSLRTRSPVQQGPAGPPSPRSPPRPPSPGPGGPSTSPRRSPARPPVQHREGKPEIIEDNEAAQKTKNNLPSSPASATCPPPPSSACERPPSPSTRSPGPASPSSRRGCSKQLPYNAFKNAAQLFRSYERSKDDINTKDEIGAAPTRGSLRTWACNKQNRRCDETGMSGGADTMMRQAGAGLSETNQQDRVKGGGICASTNTTTTTTMAIEAKTTTVDVTKQQEKLTIKQQIAKYNQLGMNSASERAEKSKITPKQQNQRHLGGRKSTTTTPKNQKQQTQQQRSKKVQELEAKQRDQANIMKMFEKMKEEKQQQRPAVKIIQQQTTASEEESEQQQKPVKASEPQQQTTAEDQQQTPTEATRSRKIISKEQQQVKTKNNKQPKQIDVMKTKPTKRKQQQQQEDDEMQKQQKITRYVNKQEDRYKETTTTKPETEQQQQTNNTSTEQQQQQQPRMKIKSKGIVISDLNKFLEQKKSERAARVKEPKIKAESAECHDRLRLSHMQSAHRPRPGEIRGPVEQLWEKTDAANGR